MPSSYTRRDFLAVSGAAAALACAPHMVQTAVTPGKRKFADGSIVLFQGDSITDMGRSRQTSGPVTSCSVPSALGSDCVVPLGNSYPAVLAYQFFQAYPDRHLQFYNRGVSGNTVPDLQARWDTDTLALQPNVLSILIGVNDIWHALQGSYKGTAADYENQYNALLDQTKAKLPNIQLVVMEPFVLKTGAVDDSWFPAFDERRAIAARVAKRAGATFVPLQDAFNAAAARRGPASYWIGDGVHPTAAGHVLIAEQWRAATGW